MTYSDIICIGGLVLLCILCGIGALKLHYFLHRGTIEYFEQKIGDPTLKPSRRVKYTSRFGMYTGAVVLLGMIGFMIYGFYSTGQMVAVGCMTVFALLSVIMMLIVNTMWRRFDL